MDPIVTTSSLEFSPLHVFAIVVIALAVGVLGITIRRFLLASADELLQLWRELGPLAAEALLRRRRGMPTSPWFCATCRSQNSVPATRCYSCGARRTESEAPVPDAEMPGGASGGRAQRRG